MYVCIVPSLLSKCDAPCVLFTEAPPVSWIWREIPPTISRQAHTRDTGLGGKARAPPWNDAAILWLLPPTVWKSRHYWSRAPEGLKLENSWLGPPNIFLQSLFTHSHVPRCTPSLFTQGLQKYRLGSVSVQTHNKRLDYVGNVEETRCILMLVSANADVFLTRSR